MPTVVPNTHLTQGPFAVCEGNGFDPAYACDSTLVASQGGVFQLPCEALTDTCTSGKSQAYTIWARALAAGEDWRATDQASPVLLVVAGRGTSAPEAVWPDAATDQGSAGAERVALRLLLRNVAEGGESEQYLRNRLHGSKRGSPDGQKRAV
jgi:hypothetical protein